MPLVRRAARAAAAPVIAAALAGACRSTPAPPLAAQTSGAVEIAAVAAPVRVVRDRWGVPHIYAAARDDLFAAQGFVQAQDRLFQMDLWRRAAQGRLAEVLGPNFVERDAMTRRVQYRGDMSAEWASYGPDAQAILTSFVRGINAWVALARERPPEEFVRAGWLPDYWSPADLLNRTDAFLESGGALEDVARLGLPDVVADAIRRVGTAPFFASRSTPPVALDALRPAAVPAAEMGGGALTFTDVRRQFETPSPRYLVHLNAPGWNVIGATAPWLPGVSAGHNDAIAWASAPAAAHTEDVSVERIDVEVRRVREAIRVRGRAEPFVFTSDLTPHGVIVASDREHGRAFALRWSGVEPGGAGELGALAIDRAGDERSFRDARQRWKMPVRQFVFTSVDGAAGVEDAGSSPPRSRTDPPPPIAYFPHVLGVSDAARRRFDVGPLPRPTGNDGQVQLSMKPSSWDDAQAMNAPGQSGSPSSPHFADLAPLWSTGRTFPLVYSDAAVREHAESTLELRPRADHRTR